MRKGQSAMEYLMTYGWAILVIIIVIAVLFYIGVLNPRNVTPTVCNFPPGISCSSFKLTSPDGQLFLIIGQATGHKIHVTNVACSQETTASDTSWTPETVDIIQGETGNLSSTAIQCYDVNGLAITGATAGETAKFRIWINYTEADTGMTRQVLGDMTGRYEP